MEKADLRGFLEAGAAAQAVPPPPGRWCQWTWQTSPAVPGRQVAPHLGALAGGRVQPPRVGGGLRGLSCPLKSRNATGQLC